VIIRVIQSFREIIPAVGARNRILISATVHKVDPQQRKCLGVIPSTGQPVASLMDKLLFGP